MAEVKKAATKRKVADRKVRFLVALPGPMVQRIERLAFSKRQKLGARWFRNDMILELLDEALSARNPKESATPTT